MSTVPEPNGDETIIERLNQNEEMFHAMLSMPTYINEQMVESRREELFSMFWEEMDMEKQEVLSNIKDQENHYLEINEEFTDDLPEWLLRMDAQDTFLRGLHEKFEEEGVL